MTIHGHESLRYFSNHLRLRLLVSRECGEGLICGRRLWDGTCGGIEARFPGRLKEVGHSFLLLYC